MRKKIVLAVAAMSCFAVMATGCGKSDAAKETTAAATEAVEFNELTAPAEESETEAEDETNAQLANPWHDSDKEGVTEATGVELTTPEDAENVAYSYMDDENLAQVTFNRGEQNWIYRAMASDTFDDISGMYYDWTNEEESEVSGRRAVIYDYSDDNETIWMIDWYDEVPGIMYSMSVTTDKAENLDGLDMQGMAELLFTPMQDDVDGDAAESDNAESVEDTVDETVEETTEAETK